MAERIVKIVGGDWSNDGHCITETHLVKIFGADPDISDEALQKNYTANVARAGFGLDEILNRFEVSHITSEQYDKLVECGWDPEHDESYGLEFYCEDRADGAELSGIGLIMWYALYGGGITEWEIVPDNYPILVGGSNSILKPKNKNYDFVSFGYGLFSP